MRQLEEVVQKLQDLQSPDRVAGFLDAAGVKGRRGGSTQCPIAKYVARETGLEYVSAGPMGIGTDYRYWVYFSSPYGPVQAFMENFDRNLYPELDESRELVSA